MSRLLDEIRRLGPPPHPTIAVRVEDIDLSVEGVEKLRSEIENGMFGKVVLDDTARKLRIFLLGNVVVDCNINATGPSLISDVTIEATRDLTVHRLKWIDDLDDCRHTESPSNCLRIRCDTLRLTEQITVWSKGPPTVSIQCNNEMICGLRGNRPNHMFPAKIYSVGTGRQGGHININIGGKLVVEMQPAVMQDSTVPSKPQSQLVENLCGGDAWIVEHIRDQLKESTPYLLLCSSGHEGYEWGISGGYQCGHICINTALQNTESADLRFVSSRSVRNFFWTNDYLVHINDDLQCVVWTL